MRGNAITERWIGGCRRELLDRTLIWNQPHLHQMLRQYEAHHNQHLWVPKISSALRDQAIFVDRATDASPPSYACDVSGSTMLFTGPVASAAWILARATTAIPAATAAAVTFGDTARPVIWPGHAPARVTTFTATACYEDFRGAIDALDGPLGLSRPGAARLLVIISDGQYKDTQHADGQARITRLAASGCGSLWLVPGQPGNQPMTGARVIILADPAATTTTATTATAATRALHGA